MKSSVFDSEPFQGLAKVEIPGRDRQKLRAEPLGPNWNSRSFLTDPDAELFMFSIQCIRFEEFGV